MRINQIKLSGFKSFVDPTTLTLPGDLTGVVGPNGCGKSNVIDAMIWVLGESSAKHLRGDSMTDVIFSGSNTRKPVGQATVEIIFDNSDHTIAGQYASFNEISIKRVLGRDAISNYYLNGTRCRRKDITNVFLGTGIGPRGYSVIEQGMISRVIEAKPEELRSFLEEAAGISKYKERRRETENRIKHSEENIERLNDIREELDKQLRHLKRQASAAEKYKTLRAEERQLNAMSIAEEWQELNGRNEKNNLDKARKETLLESANSLVTSIETKQEAVRVKHSAATDDFNKRQADFYSKSSEISRIEQSLVYSEEREGSFNREIVEISEQLNKVSAAISEAESLQNKTAAELELITPRLKMKTADVEEKNLTLKQAELDLERWRRNWDEFNISSNEVSQENNSLKIRLEHLAASVPARVSRKDEIAIELNDATVAKTEDELLALRKNVEELSKTADKTALDKEVLTKALSDSRAQLEASVSILHGKELLMEKQKGELGSIKAVIEKELGEDQESITTWFDENGVNSEGRLADLVNIEEGWEPAVEATLRVPLNAFCGDGMVNKFFQEDVAPMRDFKVTILDTQANQSAVRVKGRAMLSDKVSGPINMQPFLAGVYTASSDHEALKMREHLSPQELVVTARGSIFAKNWAQLPDENGEAIGVLALERQIHQLEKAIELTQVQIKESLTEVERLQDKIAEQEENLRELIAINEKSISTLEIERSRLAKYESDLEVSKVRIQGLNQELSRIDSKLDHDNSLLEGLTTEYESSQKKMTNFGVTRASYLDKKDKAQETMDAERRAWSAAKEEAHAVELTYESLRQASAASVKDVKQNLDIQDGLKSRLTSLNKELVLLMEPRQLEKANLETALAEKLKSEHGLVEARNLLEGLNDELSALNSEYAEKDGAVSDLKTQLENVRLEERTFQVQLSELMTRFDQTEEVFESTLEALQERIGEPRLSDALETLRGRISKLEPINLAAIDEFEELSERKIYLDKQDADLTEALNTLRGAIRKIDGETKARFKETYDSVDEKLQEMFPVLFGGGKAHLEMTEDDLLNTGVTVMARPPGKRNSSIQLLSGGEKALTALAFVFSIFELNPAPFCLLDEVDAPLDDANVVRLTELLKSMSETVQFLFVTHNKITMEIAEQLIGVTMQEAGVSRLVSVNIDKAVALAATA